MIAWTLSMILSAVAVGQTSQPTVAGEKHYLYVTVPDAAGGSGKGPAIFVYDIEDGHKLVKRIAVPEMKGTRGSCASAAAGRLFISHGNSSLMCWDILSEKVVWNVTYPREQGGADRACVTPDGKKLYVPEGWWSNQSRDMKVVDGETGKTIKTIPLAAGAGHNSIMGPTGERMYMGPISSGTLFVVDTKTDEIVKRFGGFSGKRDRSGNIDPGGPVDPKIAKHPGGRVSPYTINGSETLCFVNTSKVGFFVGDLVNQKVLHWCEVTEAKGFSHGVGMTPDEKEIWLTNPSDKKLHVFDATAMPPKYVQPVDVSASTHGWVTFDLLGRFAYPDTGDVIDTKTKKTIAEWKDDKGGRIRSSKFIEVHIKDGKVIRIGDQFGIGRQAVSPVGTK
jgi:DNA-binding beta-propeller fold protein YncE